MKDTNKEGLMRVSYSKYSLAQGVRKAKTKTFLMFSLLGLALGGGGGLSLALVGASHAASLVTVTSANTQGWYSADTRTGGAINYVHDASSPYPTGALQLTTDSTNTAKAQYLKNVNIPLSQINTLKYWTKQVSGAGYADPSFQLVVYLNGGTSGFTTLVYEPYWQNGGNPDNAPVVNGTWQQWNVESGIFWSSKTVAPLVENGAGGPPFYTLPQIMAAYPNAELSAIGVNVGSYNPNYVVETDGINFNGTVYNFELAPPEQVTGMNITQGTKEIGCGGYVNQRTITVSWNASSDPYVTGYDYQAAVNTNSPDFTTTVSSNSRTGTIRDQDGTYNYRVRAVDQYGAKGQWSDWCSVTLDRVAPVVAITSPSNGDTVYGTVDVRGSVTDANPDHYYAVVKDSNGNVVAGLGVVYDSTSFTDQHLFNWNTTTVPDGNYVIDLEARDKANNKDSNSVATVDVTVNNTPDNVQQCKDDGWANFTKPSFRNQGLCVSWVEHNVLGHGTPASNKPSH